AHGRTLFVIQMRRIADVVSPPPTKPSYSTSGDNRSHLRGGFAAASEASVVAISGFRSRAV
ncbi:MAG: hypothetical protein ACR2OH_13200, partial [Microthrixaceae bacterium]